MKPQSMNIPISAALWVSLLVFFAVDPTYAQLTVLTSTIDPITRTFPFPPINRNSKPDVVIGTVKAVDTTVRDAMEYYLINVAYMLENGTEVAEPVAPASNWRIAAETLEQDDCTDEVLKKYPEFRRFFCVDHNTGVIRVTKYFEQNPPITGSTMILTILYRAGRVRYPSDVSPHSVKIFSSCDLMNEIYQNMTLACQKSDVIFQNLQINAGTVDELLNEIEITYQTNTAVAFYLSVVNLRMTMNIFVVKTPILTFITSREIKRGENLTIEVSYNGGFTRRGSFTYLAPNTNYSIQMDPPIRMTSKAIMIIKIFSVTYGQIKLKRSWLSLSSLPVKDFCTNDAQCSSYSKQYITEFGKNILECQYEDNYLFYSKYGYCEDNPAPVVNSTTAQVDWDRLNSLRQPLIAVDEYAFDMNNLSFKINNVSMKYKRHGTDTINVNGHSDCTSNTNNVNLPLGYFCLNENTGALYVTNEVALVAPDDVFNVTIQIDDVIQYPPRITQALLTITLTSVCKSTVSLYRNVFEHCDKTGERVSMRSINNNMIQLQRNFPETYYITGLRKVVGLFSQFDQGSFLRFRLQEVSSGKTIETKHYNKGQYTPFNETLQYVNNTLYQLTATFYNIITKTESVYPVNLTKWEITLTKKDDYCTPSPNCIDLYSKYKKEYDRRISVIEGVCATLDVAAFYAKYGYCNETIVPTILKTEYQLLINSQYSGVEVIPSSSTFYTTAANFQYDIISVKWKGNILTATTPATTSAPSQCTKTYAGFPQQYFCINENTGQVYTTDAILGLIDLTTTLEIDVEITDDRKFPVRKTVAQLNLITTDECAPASNLYQNLSSCVIYSTFSPTSVNSTTISFEVVGQFQAVIGVAFKKQALQLTSTSTQFFLSVKSYYPDGSFQKTATSSNMMASSLTDTSSVPLTITEVARQSRIEIQFIETTTRNIISISQSVYDLKYIQTFACTPSCVNAYKEWKIQSVVAEERSGVKCTQDSEFYGKNFDVCIDPQPTFTSSPSITKNIVTGDNVVLSNCNYKSPYKFTTSYWLQNGVTRWNATLSPAVKRRRRDVSTDYPNLPLYNVGDLLFNKIDRTHQGTYQCVLEYGTTTVLSEKIILKLTDISETTFTMRIASRTWNAKMQDKTSTEYQQLETRLKLRLEDKLNAADCCGSKSLRFIEIKKFTESATTILAHGQVMFNQVTSSQRLTYCQNISDVITDGTLGDLDIKDVTLLNFDCCLSTTDGDITYKGQYRFSPILTGALSLQNCMYGSRRIEQQIQRACVLNVETGPQWSPLILDVCLPKTLTTRKLLELSNETVTADNVEEVSKNLSTTVKTGALTTKYDIIFISNIITKIIAVNNITTDEVTADVLDTVDTVMDADEDLIIAANQETQSSATILNQLEKLAQNQILPTTTNQKIINKNHLAMGVAKPTQELPLLFIAMSENSGNTEINITQNGGGDTATAVCVLPKEVISKSNGDLIYSFVFENDVFFLNLNQNSTANNSGRIVQSVILSASVGQRHITNLTNPIEFSFKKKRVPGKIGKSVCKFWDTNLNDSSNGNYLGGWSSSGCTTVDGDNANEVKCRCDHLTNFALLLDVDQSGSNPLALQIITWIGCGLSLAGLFLTVLTFTIFRNLRKKLPPKILISLCISLMAVLIVFLAGVEKTSPRIGCQIVAALLHYFILTTFFWMAVEGLNLYRNFVKVFSGGASDSKFLIKSSLFAWGLPLAIVGATAGAASDFLGPASSDDPQFCVLRGTPFYFALIVPVCIVMAGNLLVLILVVRGISHGSRISKDTKKEENEKLTRARIAFACSILLGSTWLFAILAVGDLRDFFQWLFCIFNSLQGLFIFIFYCVRSAEVQRSWKRFFGTGELQGQSTWMASKYNTKNNSVWHGGELMVNTDSAGSRGNGTSFSRTKSDAKDERRPSTGNGILLKDKT